MKVKKITMKIVHPQMYDGLKKDLEEYVKHNLGICNNEGLITFTEEVIEDPRQLPDPPEYCQSCEYCKGKECWHEGIYYGTDFSPVDNCYKPKT